MKFFKRKLKNGTTVLMEKRYLPVISLSITNKFGAGNETSKIKGAAHFIEHLLFTGTKTRSHEDISREIEKKGGILNGFTANEITSFWFKLPSKHIFAGLDILTDLLNNPTFDELKFEKEKKVILEEIKMYHDSPEKYIYDKIEENLYKKPFGESITGSEKTISPMKRNFVANLFKRSYNPRSYIVTLVGNANFDKVCSYLEKNFKPRKDFIKPIFIKKKNSETSEKRAGIDQAHFIFAIHAPLANDPNSDALEVLDAYLANGMSSRLFLKIREEKGLAYSIRSSITCEKSYSYYSIYIGTTAQALDEVKKIILDEFKNIANMTKKDLEEAKERLIGLSKISAEESSNVMNELLFSEIANDARDYYKHEKNIRKVTLQQVKTLAKIKRYSSAVIIPK